MVLRYHYILELTTIFAADVDIQRDFLPVFIGQYQVEECPINPGKDQNIILYTIAFVSDRSGRRKGCSRSVFEIEMLQCLGPENKK